MSHRTADRGISGNSEDEPIFSARGVRLGYRHRVVLDQVSLDVRAGEFWFVVGPNGHGKTTLLRAMMGRVRPMSGTVRVRGDFARPERMGFVPQQCSMNPALPTTVREFVLLGLVGITANGRDQNERLAWSLQQVGLDGRESSSYWSLSGGQQQRALVARALVRRPRLLVADEPTSGMDLSVESALYESFAALNRREQLTVILVTHDLAVAARYGSHVALVHHGRVEAGAAAEILQSDALQQAYGVPIQVRPRDSGVVDVRLGVAERPEFSTTRGESE